MGACLAMVIADLVSSVEICMILLPFTRSFLLKRKNKNKKIFASKASDDLSLTRDPATVKIHQTESQFKLSGI